MLSSSILVVAIVVIGVGLTTWMTDRLRFEERVAIGAVGGALVTSTTTLIAFTAVGMGWGRSASDSPYPESQQASESAGQPSNLVVKGDRCGGV